MKPFVPNEAGTLRPELLAQPLNADIGKPFKELKADIKRITELLESIDKILKEMNKKQK
ncbi:MAG: hypothetical protein PHN61_13260 [Methanothrix sp.]|nr:hypothetical protein [Methanothrix sp.]